MVVDISGQKFGFLTILCKSDKRDNSKSQFWRVKCDCGVEKEINGAGIRRGVVVSCGCYAKQKRKEANTKHGDWRSLTYMSWGSMIQRCTNPNNDAYPYYGGRGISVCDEWKDYANFLADMGKRTSVKLTLERIDNEKGYSKDNCKWATWTEQSINRRMNKNNTTGVVGVFFVKRKKKYIANIHFNNKTHLLGEFKTLEEAAKARKEGEYWRSQIMGKRVGKL